MLQDHNEIIRNRYAKADALRENGYNPYCNRWETPTHTSDKIRESQEQLIASEEIVFVAGRVMVIRHMGKAAFLKIKDNGGRIQIYARKDDLGEETWKLFKGSVDIGDIVGIKGKVFITMTGELSIHATSLSLLTKSTRPLPEKWHGLTDIETRYRQRYVDLIVNDDVRDVFVKRSRMISCIRQYLTGRGYLEVETPILHPILGGAAARPFKTHHNAFDMPLYLRIAPELYLKRLTVGGLEKVFEINRSFRNEGVSYRHNPEFTMLELYTAYWDYKDTMELTEQIIQHVAEHVYHQTEFKFGDMEFSVAKPFRRLPYLDAIKEFVPCLKDVELSWTEDPASVYEKLKPTGLTFTDTNCAWKMLTEVFEEFVEKHLIEPVFIIDFPKATSPLAKCSAENPDVAERFEMYVCGMELANAYSELNDPRDQYERFSEQVKAREAGDEEAVEMDEDYVRALEYGMPPTSGLGIGMDRLAMLLNNSPCIRDVILFPLMKPEEK